MARNISSNLTFFHKFVFPCLFLVPVTVMFLYFTLSLPLGEMFIPALFFSIWLSLAYTFFRRSHFPLKRICVEGERILVSNYVKKIDIRVSDISETERKRFAGLEVIYIHLKSETEYGRKIMFIPAAGQKFHDTGYAKEMIEKEASEK